MLHSLSQVANSSAPWNLAVIAANAATHVDDGKREEGDRRYAQPAAHPRRRECAADEREDRDDGNLDDPRGHRI